MPTESPSRPVDAWPLGIQARRGRPMFETFSSWFSTSGFMPHGHCWLWTPGILWLQVLTNLSIGLAYLAISATLAYLVYRIRDIPFRLFYLAFGVFIVTCGITHFMDVWVIWRPDYWVDGGIRLVTAVASVGTAMLLPPLVPRALALARGAKAAHDRGVRLESAVQDLERLYARATELDRLKSAFFADVSHELRTPLALVIGPLEQLERLELAPEVRREVTLASRNVRLLLGHVEDLLEVAKLEAGEAKLKPSRLDLAALVRTAAANFDGLARERGIAFRVDASDPLWTDADADRLRRAMLNVLSNAFKFTPADGRVRVSVQVAAEARQAVIEVADSGPGIPEVHRESVFERFRRLDGGPVTRFGSTGLGLPIVRDVATLHGGVVEVGDAPEGGLSIRLVLPLATGRDEAPLAATGAPAADPGRVEGDGGGGGDEGDEPTASGRPVALVVEDNRDLREFLRRVLEPDYQVFTAPDGEQGFDRARALVPDVIVSDLMMSGGSGEVLVRRVRQAPELEAVSIVLLTARADEDLRIELLRSGAQDWLQKPFLPLELRARVDNLVQVSRVRRLLQQQLESRSTDLESMVRQLGVARSLAERSSELKSSFLRAVSHEFRSPLHAIGLQLAVLERGDPSVREAMLVRLRASVQRLRELIESLLQKARLEGEAVAFSVQSFSVADMVTDVLEAERARAEGKQLGLLTEVPNPLPDLRSDPDLVRLIVANLIRNAVRFTEHGQVQVSVSLASDGADRRHAIVVRDTGPGLPSQAREGLFEPFATVHDVTRAHSPGLGLGLSLARDLTRALGGELSIDSDASGTVVTVLLPSLDRDLVA